MTHDELADRLELVANVCEVNNMRAVVCDELRSLAAEARALGRERAAIGRTLGHGFIHDPFGFKEQSIDS